MTAIMSGVHEVGGPPGLDVDPGSLPGETAHAGMVAAFRADNHAGWQRHRWLLSACRSRAGTTARRSDDPRAAQAAAAAFGWSSAMAAARYEFAHQILERLPMIGEAMQEGWLEESKASILVSTVRELDDVQARRVVALVLGRAAELPHRALATLTEKTAADVDPAWDEARRAAAEARARVLARIGPSGAAELSGLDLPVDPALEAHGHVVAVADAVRVAAAVRGVDLGQGLVQSHVFVRLLQHDLLVADDATVVETLTDELAPQRPDDDPGDDGDGDGDGGPDDGGPDDGGPDDGDRGGDGGEPDDAAPDDDGGPDGGSDGDGRDDPAPDNGSRPDDGGRRDGGGPDGGSGPRGTDPNDGAPHASARDDDRRPGDDLLDDLDDEEPDDDAPEPGGICGTEPLAFRSGVAVRLELSTMLGRDRRSGEIPGWGAVGTRTARRIAARRRDAMWRVLLYDPDGGFDQVLAIRAPDHQGGGLHRRQVVELVATAATIDALDPAEHLGLDAHLVRQARAALAAARARPPEEHPAVSAADRHRRHPRAALDRHVRARDRCCRFPGCCRPAIGADLDHTLDWLYDGLTDAPNLGALCRFHHRLKHDPRLGWSLTQPTPGRFEWISPQGARHTVEPVTEAPPVDPLPRDGGGFSLPTEAVGGFPRATDPIPWSPRRNRAGFLTDAARVTADEIARRFRRQASEPPSRYDADPDF